MQPMVSNNAANTDIHAQPAHSALASPSIQSCQKGRTISVYTYGITTQQNNDSCNQTPAATHYQATSPLFTSQAEDMHSPNMLQNRSAAFDVFAIHTLVPLITKTAHCCCFAVFANF